MKDAFLETILNKSVASMFVIDSNVNILYKNTRCETEYPHFLIKNKNDIKKLLIDNTFSKTTLKISIEEEINSYEITIDKFEENRFLITFETDEEIHENLKGFTYPKFIMKLSEMTDSIIFILSEDRKKILYINDAFEIFFGIKKEILYKNPTTWMKFLAPRDLKKLLRIRLKNDKKSLDIELKVFDKNKELNWIRLILYRIEENNKAYFMGTIRDIGEKKRNELKLTETNFRFKSVMANLPECIWIYSFETQKYFVSKGIKEILGYSQEEFSDKKKIWEAIHPKYRSKIKKYWINLIRKKELFDIEFLMRHKNGNYKWVRETIFHHFKRDNITYYEGIIRDINENKQSVLIKDVIYNITTAIYISKDLFTLCEKIHDNMNRLFNTSNIFFALYNDETKTFDVPYILDQKDRVESFPAGKSLSAYVIKVNKPILLRGAQIDKLNREGKIDYVGTMSKIWMGVPLIYNNKTIGIISLQDYENENQFNEKDLDVLNLLSYQIAQSIIAKKTELTLKKSRENNFAILNAMPDLILKIDIDGKFIDYEGERFYRPPEEFIGKSVFDILPKELATKTQKAVIKAIATNSIVNYEYELSKDDNPRYFDARIVRVNDEEALSIVRDITKKKETEMQIERTLAEKNSLLMEVHHRVKNNMQIIASLLNMQANYKNFSDTATVIREIKSRIRAMSLIHEKLYENNDFSEINLASYIHSLAIQIISSFSDICPRINLRTDVDNVLFDINIAIPLGLIINEILLLFIKNKIFTDSENKILEILFKKDEKYVLTIKNNGKKLSEYLSANDISYRIINILVSQIEAKLETDEANEIKIIF